MSKYTTEVRFICETSAGLVESEGFNSINTILNNCIENVFNFDFPIFDETYRPVLEKKILKHYYTREIATETVGLWKHYLDMRLNEIMPYYNKLYTSELLEFNPLYDVDVTTTHEKEGGETGTDSGSNASTTGNTGTITDAGTGSRNRTDNLSEVATDSGSEGVSGSNINKNTRRDYYSDTPQGAITNVENETYLTNYRKIVDDGTGSTNSSTTTFGKSVTTNNTGTQNVALTDNNKRTLNTSVAVSGTISGQHSISTTEEYLQHVVGKTPGTSYSKLLAEYRDTFLNIDMQIIDELSDLFFNLW